MTLPIEEAIRTLHLCKLTRGETSTEGGKKFSGQNSSVTLQGTAFYIVFGWHAQAVKQ